MSEQKIVVFLPDQKLQSIPESKVINVSDNDVRCDNILNRIFYFCVGLICVGLIVICVLAIGYYIYCETHWCTNNDKKFAETSFIYGISIISTMVIIYVIYAIIKWYKRRAC